MSQFVRFAREILFVACVLLSSLGCQPLAKVHVWKPGAVAAPPNAKLAIAPLSGNRNLAQQIEQQMLAQRPVARANVSIFTPEQLALRSPVRLASTAALSSDLTALQAARGVGAEMLLHGHILAADLEPPSSEDNSQAAPVNMNQMFFQRRDAEEGKRERILISWRILDVASGKTLGTHVASLRTEDAKHQFPDLVAQLPNDTEMLIAASAREAWTALAPVVVKDDVRLARPWFQPGSLSLQLGVRAAKQGDWKRAEEHWQRVARWLPFQAAAHHNLAVALAAREDFPGAKQQLLQATGPFAWNLPGETLFWLDQRQRDYHKAHGFADPPQGWAFEEHGHDSDPHEPTFAAPQDIEDLPWWTAIPFTKPPGWTWKAWLTQPLAL